jgi:hypothetical protein
VVVLVVVVEKEEKKEKRRLVKGERKVRPGVAAVGFAAKGRVRWMWNLDGDWVPWSAVTCRRLIVFPFSFCELDPRARLLHPILHGVGPSQVLTVNHKLRSSRKQLDRRPHTVAQG